ncbi:MAG: hypothetical protein VXX29_02905, partial [Verrucomicrobiota bacterium]|nr:hypothetical protein [Verrucomicrobiota bacterium]
AMACAMKGVEGTLAQLPQRAHWRDSFETALKSVLPQVRILGCESPRLWNTSCFVAPQFENFRWVGKLDKLGFEISTGSACSTAKDELTPSASAFSLTSEETRRILRVSSYFEQDQKDWQSLANAFQLAFDELSEEASASPVISV